MRVLAVDDDPMTLMIVAGVVEAAGHECVTAGDGAQGWELLRASGADVVITDWRMPGIDGLELCRRIRAEVPRYTYVVLATSRSDRAEVLQGMEAGADDYLTKPLDLADLRVRLVAAERVTALHARLADQQDELERLNAELALAARSDPLTGLRNRRALDEDLPRLLARCERHGHELSAVMVDVDHFKSFNDRFGHPAGDEVLRRVAHVLLSAGRQADLFYRVGGEEFLCLFPQGAPAALAAAERLRREVQELAIGHPDSAFGVVTFSAGVATWERATTQDALLTDADAALYRAKAEGRNAVRSTAPVQASTRGPRSALQRKHCEEGSRVPRGSAEAAEVATPERGTPLRSGAATRVRPMHEELRVLEESLWRAETRFDARYMDEVLAPDFMEFGRSGRRYDRADAVGVGSSEDRIAARLPLEGFEVHLLAEDVALVTYISEVEYDEVLLAHRSSVWVRHQGRWQLRFHQGTPT